MKSHFAVLRAAAACLCTMAALPAAAQTWLPQIPDAYQHQRWGAKPGQAVPGEPGGVTGAADPGGDSLWQASNYVAAPESVNFFGLCFQTSNVNQLYYFRQRGFTTFGANNPTNVTQLHNEIPLFATAFQAAPGNTPNSINKVLDDRGAGPSKGLGKGLLAQNFKQVSDRVQYISATGVTADLGKNTLFEHVKTIVGKEKDAANLRLAYTVIPAVGAPQRSLWWRGPNADGGNFHNVTVAGFDATNVFFADPDSNPTAGTGAEGNRNFDGGWKSSLPIWKSAPAAVAAAGEVKPRRFAEGATPAGVPVPAGAAPTAAEQRRLYFSGTLDATKTALRIADMDFNRYDGVQIRYLETMEVKRADNRPAPAPIVPLGGAGAVSPFTFEVSPTLDSTNRINQFFVFPASPLEALTAAVVEPSKSSQWTSNIIPAYDPGNPMSVLYMDPWGNARPYGGVELSTTAGDVGSLVGSDILAFDYMTAGGGKLTAWDFVYNDRFDASLESLAVQVIGDLSGYDLASQQIPEPAALALVVIAGALMFNRQGRARRRCPATPRRP